MQIDNSFFPVNISGKQNDALVNTSYTNIADLSQKDLEYRVLNLYYSDEKHFV